MEEEDPSPTYARERRPPIFRRDRHLASALARGEIDYLLSQWDNPRGLKREHHLLKRDTKNVTFLPSDQYIHWALLHISSSPPSPRYTEQLLRHMRIDSHGCYYPGPRRLCEVQTYSSSSSSHTALVSSLLVEEDISDCDRQYHLQPTVQTRLQVLRM
ncbi:jg23224 [Pararge aegeria aegeria]|uniref:Jg23224 protein n=1 Tax=Pararge aegeria aegeria TaxID=348720 RepID=A0A8S4RJV5_9NEOP|nr:jg23224 [Pararge aegeria aegeria]